MKSRNIRTNILTPIIAVSWFWINFFISHVIPEVAETFCLQVAGLMNLCVHFINISNLKTNMTLK